ncbi:MAG: hypothetical protein IPI49_01000 [Myxococcales bacterium]|nr:hypothetical protein [Myxococcales bacterium]
MRKVLLAVLLAFVAGALGSAIACTDPPRTATPGNGNPMSSFDKSLAAFQSAVAAEASVSASSLKIVPSSEKVIGHNEFLVPGFVPFLAQIPGRVAISGWANDAGTVVLLGRKNFGPILDAMGFTDPASTFPALEQARRVAWAHVGYRFVAVPSDFGDVATPPGGGPPAITREGGATTLTFFMVEVGDTGFQAAVKCVVRRDAQGSYTYTLGRA